MASSRKLLAEIDRVLKKVDEGVDTFNDIYEKIQTASNANQKDKYEGELKKEIKKLQRLRDSIKGWLTSNDIKDKKLLMEKRKLIETQMERFKVVERQTKTKAFSKEGLNQASKMDPKQKAKKRTQTWIQDFIDQLNMQVDAMDAEVETLMAGSKKKKDANKQARVDGLHEKVVRHKFHIDMLERCLRALENETVSPQEMDDIKEEVEYYVESHEDPDFQENEYLYEDFDLEADPDEAHHLREADPKDDETDMPPVEKDEKVLKKKEKEEKKKKKDKEKDKDKDADPEAAKIKKAKEQKPKDAAAVELEVPTSPTAETSPIATVAPPVVADAPPPVAPSAAPPPSTAAAAPTPKYAAAASLLRTLPPATKQAPSFSNVFGEAAPIKQDKPTPLSPVTTAPDVVGSPVGHSPRPHVGAVGVAGMVRPATATTGSKFATVEEAFDSKQGNMQTGTRGMHAGRSGIHEAPSPHASGSPGVYDFVAGVRDLNIGDGAAVGAGTGAGIGAGAGAALAGLKGGSMLVTTPTGSVPGVSWDAGIGMGAGASDEAFSQEKLMLEASFRCKPEPGDCSKPNEYTVRNPYPVAPHYRDIPHVPLDTPEAFAKLEMDPLFFAFYYQQGTYQQYLAAKELKKKSWRFHKKYRTWFQRHEDPTTITDEYEQGTYVYFDNDTSWTMRKKAEFRFDYVHLQSDP